MPTKSELMHYRLQAWIRENKCSDIEYLGDLPDTGHTYRIGEHEVPIEFIEGLELCEDDDAV